MDEKKIGNLAELIAFEEEKNSVPDVFVKNVRLVSNTQGYGYDIESIDITKNPPRMKAIEVKSWNKNGNFRITTNEINILKSLSTDAWIYLVDISNKKVVHKINNPFGAKDYKMEPSEYKFYY